MFDMFRGGKPDVMTLMAVDYEQRRSELNKIVKYIKDHYYGKGEVDASYVASIVGVKTPDAKEIKYIERQLRR